MRHMAKVKHEELDADDALFVAADDENDIAVLRREHDGRRKVGVFSLKSRSAEVEVPLPDGTYENLVDGSSIDRAGREARMRRNPHCACGGCGARLGRVNGSVYPWSR